MLRRFCLCLLLTMFLAIPAWPQQKSEDLTTRSIEDLMNIQVTSVSKTEQTLLRTASAVFIISQKYIGRPGATDIVDPLQMVLGMDVSQINSDKWAISAQGFNARLSNELLALVDGRPVYTDTSGGVYWDVLFLPLEDIERIGVIRGPGGSISPSYVEQNLLKDHHEEFVGSTETARTTQVTRSADVMPSSQF